jgi:predicted Zn finger-like uncharacterized protein
MQIACPHCGTTYKLADDAIGASGRSVRCTRCQTMWRAEASALTASAASLPVDETAAVAAFGAELGAPPSANPPSLETIAPPLAAEPPPPGEAPFPPNAETSESPATLADIAIPIADAPPLQPDDEPPPIDSLDDTGPPDIESVAARRARKSSAGHKRRRLPLSAIITVLIVLCIGLVHWRKFVVSHAPQLASFYTALGLPVNLRGLEFTDMKIGNETHDGVPVLVVEGLIVSTTSQASDVPRLRFALRSTAGAEIYAWTAQPTQPKLGAFETMPFRSRLASPPAEGHDVQVRFFTSRDAIAGPH